MNKESKIDSRTTGQMGERIAERLLISKGYEIIAKNYFMEKAKRRYEIDVITKKDDELIFAEVKTRTIKNGKLGLDYNSGIAALAVTSKKQKHIITAANYFLIQKENRYLYADLQPRFDVIEVYILEENSSENTKIKVRHIENAFIT